MKKKMIITFKVEANMAYDFLVILQHSIRQFDQFPLPVAKFLLLARALFYAFLPIFHTCVSPSGSVLVR